MSIYTNGSTFPIHKFNLLINNRLFNIEDINNFIYYPKNFDSHRDFLKIINNIELQNQHLFEALLPYSFRRVFENDKRVLSKEQITSKSISDRTQFAIISNLKLNLKAIERELEILSNNGISIDCKTFLNEIITFTYKYLFINLSKYLLSITIICINQ